MALIGYVEDTDFTAWATARGITLTGTAAVLLTRALDWVELQKYTGTATTSAAWPRSDAYIDGVLVDSATVPQLVRDLQMRVAADIDAGFDPNAVRAQTVKSERVEGAVSVEYMEGSAQSAISVQAAAILAKLANGIGGYQFEVRRG